VAEGARLESVFRGNSNVGSNPTLSASTRVCQMHCGTKNLLLKIHTVILNERGPERFLQFGGGESKDLQLLFAHSDVGTQAPKAETRATFKPPPPPDTRQSASKTYSPYTPGI
jgi:hypothetical protein